MNVREAILKAAGHIEANPEQFNYYLCRVPECGTPGCAIGWIGHFAGCDRGKSIYRVEEVTGVSNFKFYMRMSEISRDWKRDGEACAEVLRLYADKYHPAPKVEHFGIPDSVRAIFAESVAS
jgi:hypothetical protein